MRHFLVYHNAEKNSSAIVKNASVYRKGKFRDDIHHGGIAWVLVGERRPKQGKKSSRKKKFSLVGKFKITRFENAKNVGEKSWAHGDKWAISFESPIELNDMDWFEKFRHDMGNFRRFREITHPYIEHLENLVANHQPPTSEE